MTPISETVPQDFAQAYGDLVELVGQISRAPGGPPPNLWALVPKPGQQHSIHAETVNLYVLPPEDLLG